jgi:hypothetical protein
MSLRTTLSNTVRRPFAYFSREWSRMAPRERRMFTILVSAVLGAFVLAVAVVTIQSLSEIADSNDAAREALAAIAKHRDEFLEARDRMKAQEVRIGYEPPQLAADLESAAHEVNIQIPETVPRPAVPAGKRYLEHNVDVTLRQVDLLALSKFLSRLETGRRLIVVTKMSIKRHFGDGEKLNVSFTATAFERVKDSGPKKKPAPGAKI